MVSRLGYLWARLAPTKYLLQRCQWYRQLHLTYVGWRGRRNGLPNWKSTIEKGGHVWERQTDRSENRVGRVLIATGAGGHLPSMTIESLLGVALTQRHAAIDFLLCDGALNACMMCEINWYIDLEKFAENGPVDRCRHCYRPAKEMLDAAGMRHYGISGQLNEEEYLRAREIATSLEKSSIDGYTIDGVSIGEHAIAGALRFFARGALEDTPATEAILRRYFEAALRAYFAARRLLSTGRYDVVVLNHGIYVPQGVTAEVARRYGVRVVTWHTAYRERCFLFSHGDTYHKTMMVEPTDAWSSMRWGAEQESQIMEYLADRWTGKRDWISFQDRPAFDVEEFLTAKGVDKGRPCIGLLTNVIWDAQLHYPANAFSDMLEWLVKTIEYFAGRPELQLIIRIHPAETLGSIPSKQRVMDELAKAFDVMPGNVFFVRPEDRISTYALMLRCDSVLIYGTKMGVELASVGLPVIVAGEAWVRGKGITMDAKDEVDYFRLLDRLPHGKRLTAEQMDRARRYAYHFFFRRMIPVDVVAPAGRWPPFRVTINGLEDLTPGRCKGLDVICEGILEAKPFIYQAEHQLTAM